MTDYNWNFGALWQYRALLLTGLGYTLFYTALAVTLGILIGAAAGIGRRAKSRLIRWPIGAYIELFRCTPLLVQLIWFYYALPVLIGIEISAPLAAVLTLSLYGGSFYAEIVRGGIESIEAGQWDAAKALGMNRLLTLLLVVMPQAGRRMLPPMMNQSIIQLKNTSLVSVLAVADLVYQGQVITAATYRPLEVYTLTALMYFAVLYPLTHLVRRFEKPALRSGE
jgi:polar amino acid transport system permease protein